MGGVNLLKKIPYALLLMVAYLIMAWSGIMAVLSGTGAEAASVWDSVGRIANYIIALGPIVLAVLMVVNSVKPLVGQVGGVVCLLMALAYGCRTVTIFPIMREYISTAEAMDMQAFHLLLSFLSSIVFALLFWLVGARIQEEEVTGAYSGVGGIGMFLVIVFAFCSASSGITPTLVLPTLLLMNTARKLPGVFVPHVTTRGCTVKNIVILAILIGLYFFAPASLG